MEEEDDTLPPLWHQNDTPLRRSDSMSLSTGALLILLLLTALAFIFIIAPTLHSFTSHNIFKPHSVRKSWDSLNLVVVLFAILCGFLCRNNNTNETPRSYEDQTFSETLQLQEYIKPNPETPRNWDEYSERTPYYRNYNRLRSFNSYPDLRQEPPWIAADERWRFYDDTHVKGYNGLDSDKEQGQEEIIVKNIEVDTYKVHKKEAHKKKVHNAPPSPPSSAPAPAERRSGESKNKKESATKELLTSLKGKKKKQRQRSVDNFESMVNSKPPIVSSKPPPPPLPPPPPSVFNNLFPSKKSKHKKHPSISTPPPHVSSSKTKPLNGGGAITPKPRLRQNFYGLEENVITGNESPLIPIPPPPPPFNLPAWKFRVQGDYVRIDSISSTSSGSQDLDEVVDSPRSQGSQCNSPSAPHGEDPEILLFYPNPDVDTEADTFIERFRAGLRMEKVNSTKEKQGIGR